MTCYLVAIDGSEPAWSALDVACDLSYRHDATLLLVHVSRSHQASSSARMAVETEYADELRDIDRGRSTMPSPDAYGLSVARMKGREADASRRVNELIGEDLLARARDRAHSAGVEQVELVLTHGDAVASVLEIAGARKAEAIIVGCRGLGRAGALLLGSVSGSIAHAAPCRVIMVT